MVEHRDFASHPVRQILQRAAGTGAKPDEEELAEISADQATIYATREAAHQLAEAGQGGGFRARHNAKQAADIQARAIIGAIPQSYAHAVKQVEDDATLPSPGELAARTFERVRTGRASAEDIADRETVRQAVRKARRSTR